MESDIADQRAADAVVAAKIEFASVKAEIKAKLEERKEEVDSAAVTALIDDAIAALDALTHDDEKSIDDNFAAIDAFVDTYRNLLNEIDAQRADEADAAAAANVDSLIEAIGDVTLDSKDAVDEPRTAYDALTDVQKDNVDNYTVLTNAEARYAELKAGAETPDEPDPENPTDPDGDNLCKWCGKDHSVSFWQKIVGFFHNILYFFVHLFGKR